MALVLFLFPGVPLRAQAVPSPEPIGTLVGDDVAVKGAIGFDTADGRSTALLASGSEIAVRSGKARIDLADGDTIAICGPAHFTILESGGAITIALDYGEVHPQLTSAVPMTVYMPLISVTPVAIGSAPRDVTIGLDQAGELCAIPAGGALRIEQQLTGQGMLVPQGGEVSFSGGQLNTVRNASGACSCELLVVVNTPKKQLAMSLNVQPPAQPAASRPNTPPSAPPVESDTPIYRISVPLIFDAHAPRAPAPDPPTILVDEEARLQPLTFWFGRVEPAPPAPPASPVPAAKHPARNASSVKKPGLFARLFGWHRHRSAPRCEGMGCTATGASSSGNASGGSPGQSFN